MDIALLGQHFRISTDEDDQYLSNLLAHYESLIDTVKRSTSTSNQQITAILAGLLAVDEYYKLKQTLNGNHVPKSQAQATTVSDKSFQNEVEEANSITDSILSKIDEII